MFRLGRGVAAISRRGAAALACAFAAFALSGCWWDKEETAVREPTDCPAPQPLSASTISTLRNAAFAGDIAAQYALAAGYDTGQVYGRADLAEAAVWYLLALANPASYGQDAANAADARPDCQGVRRKAAGQALTRLIGPLSSVETAEVRDRAEYILSASGAAGYRTLSRLYSGQFGPYGEPLPTGKQAPAPPIGPDLFANNEADSQMFVWLARNGDGTTAAPNDPAGQRAMQWGTPFEFYPPFSPTGAALSDESAYLVRGDAAAIARIEQQPFAVIGAALRSMGVTSGVVRREGDLPAAAAERFQAMIGQPETGQLTALEKVRAIQYAAAIEGNADAQAVLGVMYAEGIGVRRNFIKARLWLQMAARQKHVRARLALDRLTSLGR